LEKKPPDLILSDHGLPSFDGFAALQIAKEQCPDTPFIFVTNSRGEETAIETFESGATDYVLKNNLSKLAPAVHRALRESRERARMRRKEKALHASEERFRMLVESVKDYAIVMLDSRGRITGWNSGAQALHGYSADEVQGRHFSLFYTRKDIGRAKPEASLRAAARDGRFHEEGLRTTKDGKTFWAKVDVSALRERSGNLRGFCLVTRDITECKEKRERSASNTELKAAMLDAALDAIISIDRNGVVQEWNPAAEKILGYSRADALGRPLEELIVPDELHKIYSDGLCNYLLTGAGSLLGRPIEMKLRRADGSEFPAEISISRLSLDDISRCTALIRDITERRQATEALRQSEERFRLLLEGVKDYAIYMLDTEGRVITWNEGAERLEGYTEKEIIGKPIATFFTPDEVQAGIPKQALERAEAEGRTLSEGWRVRKDGSRFWAQGILTALRDDDGQLRGFAKVSHDATRSKEAEDKIRRLNSELESRVVERTSQLEEANQELEAFSYSVSHDLRAPLRHIAGYVDILKAEISEKLDRKSRSHFNKIEESARQMGELIDALLAFSRMSRTEMHHDRVSLAGLVNEARRALKQETQGRSIEWQIGALPEVEGDPLMLRQVMINLLSNALKYTRTRSPARIEIGSKVNSQVVFFIRDNGVGFDMEYADKLFGVFQRLHSTSEFEGTGIGLANVRRIIHRHGGHTWAEGEMDRGATFYFSLPKSTNAKK
jgi:PAS domain S-box-containing protein